MKKLLLVFISLVMTGYAFTQKVGFVTGSWQEINDRAAKEGKFIFVDAYTEWCGWCKVMDKEMFTDPDVAPLINENFIPVKIDFEDSLGIILAMKFRVWGYPTTLIFNNYGQLTGKFSGYSQDHKRFLEFLKTNLEIKDERVFAFDSRQLDMPYPEFYTNMFIKGDNRKKTDKEKILEYLKSQDDLFSEVSWSVLLRFNLPEYIDHVTGNIDQYTNMYGKDETTDYIYDVIYRYLDDAVDSAREESYHKALKLCDKLDNPEENRISVSMNYSEMAGDWRGYSMALGSYIDLKGFENHMNINNACWTLYENTDDPEILGKACEWMQKVTSIQPIWMYLDTYAALLYKSGRLDEALKIADMAIEAGEKEEQKDLSSTKELREKIVSALENK